MAGPFATTYGSVDFSQLRQEARERLEAVFPGWESARGDLLDLLLEGNATMDADLFTQFSSLERAAFKRYGEAIAKVPQIQAASAVVESVWTMVDEEGHEIAAGTEVGIPGPDGRTIGFRTVDDTVIAPGSTKATILLQAIEPGAFANGLSSTPELETNLSFVALVGGIELLGVTADGVDEEDEGAYLDRMVEVIRLRSISLILPYDFEVDARSHAAVARAKCVRGYDPGSETLGNAGHQCLFPIDDEGEELGATVEAELLADQSARLIEGVVHHVAPPQYTPVDVVASVIAEPGFDPAAIAAAGQSRLGEALSPGKWALPANGEGSGWVDGKLKVYRNDLISLLYRVGGLSRVVDLRLARHGSPLRTADVALDGVAPLVRAGELKVSAE